MTLSDLQGHSALFKCDFVQLCRSWQDFNWHGASRGPSATVELLVPTQSRAQHVRTELNGYVHVRSDGRF